MLVHPDLLSIVASLQDAANRHAVDEVMAMFADDAGILLAGFTKISWSWSGLGSDQGNSLIQ
jgi:hypothetical protein